MYFFFLFGVIFILSGNFILLGINYDCSTSSSSLLLLTILFFVLSLGLISDHWKNTDGVKKRLCPCTCSDRPLQRHLEEASCSLYSKYCLLQMHKILCLPFSFFTLGDQEIQHFIGDLCCILPMCLQIFESQAVPWKAHFLVSAHLQALQCSLVPWSLAYPRGRNAHIPALS